MSETDWNNMINDWRQPLILAYLLYLDNKQHVYMYELIMHTSYNRSPEFINNFQETKQSVRMDVLCCRRANITNKSQTNWPWFNVESTWKYQQWSSIETEWNQSMFSNFEINIAALIPNQDFQLWFNTEYFNVNQMLRLRQLKVQHWSNVLR